MSGTDQSASAPAPTADDLLVVGLGASAGGITALRRFFSRVTPDGSTAYVVILHLVARPRQPPRRSPAGGAAVARDPGDGERTARARPRLRHLAEPEPDAGRRRIWGWPRSRASSSAARRSTSSFARSPPRTARTPSASSCRAPAPTARPASSHQGAWRPVDRAGPGRGRVHGHAGQRHCHRLCRSGAAGRGHSGADRGLSRSPEAGRCRARGGAAGRLGGAARSPDAAQEPDRQ